jgi:hypothetical protein
MPGIRGADDGSMTIFRDDVLAAPTLPARLGNG